MYPRPYSIYLRAEDYKVLQLLGASVPSGGVQGSGCFQCYGCFFRLSVVGAVWLLEVYMWEPKFVPRSTLTHRKTKVLGHFLATGSLSVFRSIHTHRNTGHFLVTGSLLGRGLKADVQKQSTLTPQPCSQQLINPPLRCLSSSPPKLGPIPAAQQGSA